MRAPSPAAWRMRALALAVALFGALPAAQAAPAQPFSLDDLLGLERFRGAVASPDGHHVSLEFAAAYDQARRYGSEEETDLALGRVAVVDLDARSPALRWIGGRLATGVTLGVFSPSGQAFTVTRLRNGRTELGVARVEGGEVRWLGLVADRRTLGRMVQWRSEREIVLLSPARERPPLELLGGPAAFTRSSQLWMRKVRGAEPSLQVMGSGLYGDLGRKTLNRLVRVDVATGRVRVLAQGDFEDLEVSPDGRAVALVSRGEDAPLPQDRDLVAADDGRRRALAVVALDTGKRRPVFLTDDILPGLLAWCKGDESLLVFARADPRREWTEGRLMSVANDGAAKPVDLGAERRTLVQRVGSESRPIVHASCLEDTALVYARNVADGRADWLAVGPYGRRVLTSTLAQVPATLTGTSDDAVLLVADQAVWRIGLDGRVRRLLSGRDLQAVVAPSPERRLRPPLNAAPPTASVSVSEADGRGRLIHRLAASDTRPTPANTDIIAVSAGGVLTWSVDPRGVGVLALARDGQRRTLTALNARLASVATVSPIPLLHRSRDGRTLHDWLYLPHGTTTPGAPPLLVLPYPGAEHPDPPIEGRADTPSLISAPQILVAHGYAVLVPSLARSAADVGDEGVAEEIAAAVDAAVASGRVDPRRVALWGHSFGGYAALLAATRSARFCAVVAEAAPVDLLSVRGVTIPTWRPWPESRPSIMFLQGWSEAGQLQLHAPPWREATPGLRSSPLAHADHLRAPVLLIHGDQDFVSLTQAEEMFWALRRLDRDAILATFWGEEHDVESPANVRALYSLAFRFLDGPCARRDPGTRRDSSVAPTPRTPASP